MRYLFMIIGLLLSACTSNISTEPPKTTPASNESSKTVYLDQGKNFIHVPIATRITVNGSLISMQLSSGALVNGSWLDAEYFLDAEISPIAGNLKKHSMEDLISFDNCRAASSENNWGGSNFAFRYSQPITLATNKNIKLIEVENMCNFPGGLRWNKPVEKEFCRNPYEFFVFTKENPKPADDSWQKGNNYLFCSILRRLNYLSTDQKEEVLKFPRFFANQEYLLQIGKNIYRIRKDENTNQKGDALLQEILMQVKSFEGTID